MYLYSCPQLLFVIFIFLAPMCPKNISFPLTRYPMNLVNLHVFGPHGLLRHKVDCWYFANTVSKMSYFH